MSTIFVTCLLHCCTRVLAPNDQWDEQDANALRSAKVHCYTEKKPNNCLIRFKKVEQGVYTAVCGEENN